MTATSFVVTLAGETEQEEKADDLKRRIGEAAKFIALDQLAISFASDIVGNRINMDE
jgi:hypothetical protein